MKAGFILIYSFVTAHNLYIGLFFCCSSVPSAWEVLPEATPSWFSLSAHPLPPDHSFLHICLSRRRPRGWLYHIQNGLLPKEPASHSRCSINAHINKSLFKDLWLFPRHAGQEAGAEGLW